MLRLRFFYIELRESVKYGWFIAFVTAIAKRVLPVSSRIINKDPYKQ